MTNNLCFDDYFGKEYKPIITVDESTYGSVIITPRIIEDVRIQTCKNIMKIVKLNYQKMLDDHLVPLPPEDQLEVKRW